MSDARHHRAVQVVFVPVPFEAGSPKSVKDNKPPRYPRNAREQWRPRDKPPHASKAEGLRRLLDGINRNDAAVRAFIDQARRAAAQSMVERGG